MQSLDTGSKLRRKGMTCTPAADAYIFNATLNPPLFEVRFVAV